MLYIIMCASISLSRFMGMGSHGSGTLRRGLGLGDGDWNLESGTCTWHRGPALGVGDLNFESELVQPVFVGIAGVYLFISSVFVQ